MGLGMPEIVIILLVIGILLFGGSKITEIARSMGSASGEFKKAKREVEQQLKESEAQVAEETKTSATTAVDAKK